MLTIIVLLVVLAMVGFGVRWRVRLWEDRLIAELQAGSQRAETARGSVEYAREGQGPVVLFLHGSLGGYDQGMIYLRALLQGQPYTLLALSRPGYGRTPLEVGRTYPEAADAVAALLDKLGIDKVAVMGTSGGGATVLQVALRHPQRCWAMVLISCATREKGYKPNFLERMMMTGLTFWLMSFFPKSARKQALKNYEPQSQALKDPQKVEIADALMKSLSPTRVRVPGTMNEAEEYARLGVYPVERINVPTLVIHGKRDPAVPFGDGEFVAKKVPGAAHYWLEHGGHAPILADESEEVKSCLIAFLKKNAPARQEGSNPPRPSGPCP